MNSSNAVDSPARPFAPGRPLSQAELLIQGALRRLERVAVGPARPGYIWRVAIWRFATTWAVATRRTGAAATATVTALAWPRMGLCRLVAGSTQEPHRPTARLAPEPLTTAQVGRLTGRELGRDLGRPGGHLDEVGGGVRGDAGGLEGLPLLVLLLADPELGRDRLRVLVLVLLLERDPVLLVGLEVRLSFLVDSHDRRGLRHAVRHELVEAGVRVEGGLIG